MTIIRRTSLVALAFLIASPLAFSFTRPDVEARNSDATESSTSFNQSGSCADDLLDGREPAIPTRMQAATQQLCYTDFVLLHSATTKTALWSAQKITRDSLRAAQSVPRTNEFYAEQRLKKTQRSEPTDYRRSGYDRGHLAPSANMPTFQGERESFSLANIIPQTASLNRNTWADLESDVRRAATHYGIAYVVTGPLFLGDEIRTLRGRVFIPSHIWKAVHVPGEGSIVIVASNDQKPSLTAYAISQFTDLYGIDPFPALSHRQKAHQLRLGGHQ